MAAPKALRWHVLALGGILAASHRADDPGAGELFSLLQAKAVASLRIQPVRHCCDATVGDSSPVVLACQASEDDRITRVDYAAIGEAPEPGHDLYTCGSNVFPSSCQERIENRQEITVCVGNQTCTIVPTRLGSPCAQMDPSKKVQVRVRYSCFCDSDGVCPSDPKTLPEVPLRVAGSVLEDGAGRRFRLNAVNWAGAHITNAPGGLDMVPVADIARQIRRMGFNAVRLTWSVESVLRNPVVDERVVAANPGLVGRHALDVLDAVVAALGHEGVLVWLDNHMLDTDWCCDRADCNGFWFNSRWTEQDWVSAWRLLANRYKDTKAVVGAGLKNEPRSVCGGRSWGGKGAECNASCLDPGVPALGCVEMAWSTGPEQYQWKRAAEVAGRAILEEKPSMVISISGLEYSTDLRQVGAAPVDLPEGHVVYEAHDYAWSKYSRTAGVKLDGVLGTETQMNENEAKSACDRTGGGCTGVTCIGTNYNCSMRSARVATMATAREFTFQKELVNGDPFPRYADKLNTWWGYLLQDSKAPVFLSEIGWNEGDVGGDYLNKISSYIQEGGPLANRGGLDWGYWQLGGVQVGGTGRTAGETESYGLLNRCWTGPQSQEQMDSVKLLMNNPATNP